MAYIDGRNVFHTLEELKIDGFSYDYRQLVEHIALKPLDDGRHCGRQLVKIAYFGARFPAELNLEKHHRDDAFYKHLKEKQKIAVCEGRFKIESGMAQEKGVDVLLATDLIVDSFYGNQCAFVFSNDTDLFPAIKFVSKKTKVFVVGPRKLEVFKDIPNVHSIGIYPDRWKKFRSSTSFAPTAGGIAALQNKFSGGGSNFGRHKK